jgi:hypothetical protein
MAVNEAFQIGGFPFTIEAVVRALRPRALYARARRPAGVGRRTIRPIDALGAKSRRARDFL